MIDNFLLLKDLFVFNEPGDFYMLYVLQRKKDQEEKENHQSVRTIKSYCIDSMEYLEKRLPEVKMLCEVFKARAYIHVARQNHKDVSLDMMVTLAERIKNGHQVQKGLFDTVVGQIKTKVKLWIVDVDTRDIETLGMIRYLINVCGPIIEPDLPEKVVKVIPTKAGYHIIARPFNLDQFNKLIASYNITVPDIQKKNPTLLYLPNTLSDDNITS